jgi:hypothetical protein
MMTTHAGLLMLVLLQLGANQLNTFENFLKTAVSGIQGSGVIAGMMNVAYVIMLIGFLWEMYQSAMHGGDVKGLGKSLVKYLATALVVQAWPDVFTSINHAFVSAGSWMTSQSGAGNVLDTWMSNLKEQFQQNGYQHTWNLITGEMAGLIDAILIFIAYLLYPIVSVIFGFFYMMMGSILFACGPLVVALLPLSATNRLAKAYIENVFIWNAWPLLYGVLGMLIAAVHLDNMSTILAKQGFLGALNGMEGSFLVGLISIVYSIAIAAIPFLAKSIVNGDVGSAARQMIAAATTAVAAGTAAFAGASAGMAAAKASSAGGASGANGALNAASNASSARGSNQPATAQPAPPAAPSNSPASQQPSSASSEATATPSVGDNSPAQESNASQSSQSSGGEKSSGAPAGEGVCPPSSGGEKAAAANTSMAASEGAALQRIQESGSQGESREAADKQAADGLASGSEEQAKSQTSAGNGNGDSIRSGNLTTGNQRSNSPLTGRSPSGGSQLPRIPAAPQARHGLATWGAYHVARIAAHGAVSTGSALSSGIAKVGNAIENPGPTGHNLGNSVGRIAGRIAKGAADSKDAVNTAAHAVSHPSETASKAAGAVSSSFKGKITEAKGAAAQVSRGFNEGYRSARNPDKSGEEK